MLEFHKLNKPTAGIITNTDKWTVFTTNDIFLVLSKDRELLYGPKHSNTEYLFDTEWEAYMASAAYYNQNLGRSYPYIDEMLVSLEANPFEFNEEDEIIESKTMEFI